MAVLAEATVAMAGRAGAAATAVAVRGAPCMAAVRAAARARGEAGAAAEVGAALEKAAAEAVGAAAPADSHQTCLPPSPPSLEAPTRSSKRGSLRRPL